MNPHFFTALFWWSDRQRADDREADEGSAFGGHRTSRTSRFFRSSLEPSLHSV